MSARRQTCVTFPVSMAACGMKEYCASRGSCAIVSPPKWLIVAIPEAPSSFEPVRIIPTRFRRNADAADSNKTSMDGLLNRTGGSDESEKVLSISTNK